MTQREIDNTSKAKGRFFCNKMFHNIFWASCMASGGLVIANIIDAVAVGSKMGEQGLAAICIVSPIYILYNVLGYGFSVGGAVIFTRLMGKGHFEQANKHLNAVVLVSVILSAIIGVLANVFLDPFLSLLGGDAATNPLVYQHSRDYASILLVTFPIFMLNFLFYEFSRCDDDEKTATCAYLAGCLSDVLCNCLLVIVLDLGVKGAAFSTVIGQIISTVIASTHFFRKKNLLVKKYVSFDIKAAFASLHLGFSTSSRHLFRCVFLVITNNILMRFASNGNLFVAIFDVVTNVSYITCFVYTAAVEAITPLASTFYAESNRTNLIDLLKKSYRYACLGSLIVSAVIFALSDPVARLFGLHGITTAVYAIRIFCLGVCFTAFSEVSGAFFQAISKDKVASLITIIQNFVFIIPLTIVVGVFRTELFWFVLPVSEALSAIVILIVVLKKLPREDKKSYTYILENNNRDIDNMLSGISSFLDDNDASIKQGYVVTLAAEEILTLVGISSISINMILSRIISKKRLNITRVSMRDAGKLSGATVAGIEMIETIKASGAEGGFFEKWACYQASVNTQKVKFAKLNQSLGIVPQLVSSLTNTAVLIIGVYLTMQGEFTIGMIMAFQGFLASFLSPVEEFISAGQTLQETKSEMERIEDVMQYPTDIICETDHAVSDDQEYDKLSGALEMKNVTFGYSRLGEPLIKDFSLSLKPGSRVAFVGSSGCGKSTLSKLISGLYQPWSGEILFDGKPIREISLRSLHHGKRAVRKK